MYFNGFKKIIYIAALMVVSFTVYGKLVMPVFGNAWFLNRSYPAQDVSYYANSCGSLSFQYRYINESPESLAQTVFEKAPQHSDCRWGDLTEEKTFADGEPISFPGTQTQWSSLVSQHSENLTKTYSSDCKDKNGNVIDSFSIEVYPIYICAKGSRQFDSVDGCVTAPPVCDADVLGRDLGSSGFTHYGHVGLASTIPNPSSPVGSDSQVMEVLNKPKVMYNNSFNSFVHNPEGIFWGEVYSPKVHPVVTQQKALNIISVGEDQFAFNPEYTMFPVTKPGKIIKAYVYNQKNDKFSFQYVVINAKFRCDTFVRYCYAEGANILLIPFSVFMAPSDLYKSFAHNRSAFPEPITFSLNNLNNTYEANTNNCDSEICYENEIDTILSSSQINADQLYNVINQYVKFVGNVSISNKFIYQEAVKYQNDQERYVLLIQSLNSTNSIGLLNQMVNDYKKNNFIDKYTGINSNKYELLRVISQQTSFQSSKDIKNLTDADIQSIINAQNLFINILKTSMDKSEVIKAISFVENVLPEDQAFELVAEAEQRLHINNVSLSVKNFILKNILNQKPPYTNVNDEINRFLKGAGISKSVFNKKLFSVLNNTNVNFLTPNQKRQLIEYVNSQSPACLGSDILNNACMLNYVRWINVSAHLSEYNFEQKHEFIIKTLISMNNTNSAVKIFLGYNPKIFKNVESQLLIKLKNKLMHNDNTNNQVMLLKYHMAMSNIDILLKSS